MFKRKSNPPTISPLPPPTSKPQPQVPPPPPSQPGARAPPNGHSYNPYPSPASPPNSQVQIPMGPGGGRPETGAGPGGGNSNGNGNGIGPRPPMIGGPSSQGSPGSGSFLSSTPTQTQRGSPAQSSNNSGPLVGPPAERTMSNGTTGKQEKRKSFFGLGGQKKDKDEKKESAQDRRKSEVTAAAFQQHQRQLQQQQQRPGGPLPPQHRASLPPQGSGDFQPHAMRQFAPPENGQTPPPPQPGSPVLVDERGQRTDLTPSATNPNFKSHTIGVASRSGTQERAPLPANGGNGVGGIGSNTMPRSTSMPINGQGNGSNGNGNGTGVSASSRTRQPSLRDTPFSSEQHLNADGRAAWMDDFDAIVELISLQPHKTYIASPPELEMILARTSAGQQPKQGAPGSPNNDWDSVWLQLSGTSLSTWSMKETRAAAAKGEKVPPTYYNITDSSLELLAALPPPPHRPNSHPHRYVFSLNTAGSNRLLFSGPSERDLAAWTTALRLAAWERARLEEIYTAHLIRSAGREPRSLLVRGRMEGWVRVRVMGGTDWRRLWAVLNTPESDESTKEDEKKSRRRSFFGIGDKQPEQVQEPNTGVPMASFYAEPRTPKNKTVPPVLTITGVTQAYAVFPERLEVISASNLMKLVGRVGGDMVTIEGRLRDSGWALIMPDTSGEGANGSGGGASTATPTPLVNMMRWVTAFHDVFKLYGRPERYNWDEKDPNSLFFAYPRGNQRGTLFLSNDEAMMSDFRTPSLASVRRQFTGIVQRRLAGMAPVTEHEHERSQEDDEEGATTTSTRPDGNYRLPPLSFDSHVEPNPEPRSLTPITERTDIASRTNSTRTANSRLLMDFPQTQTGSGGSAVGVGAGTGGTDRGSIGGVSTSSKQGSRDSNKPHEERLEPISDTETFGPYTDEPAAVVSGASSTNGFSGTTGMGTGPNTVEEHDVDRQLTPVLPTPSSGEHPRTETASTVWSQSSAQTPVGSGHGHSSGETHREANNKTPTPVSPPGPPVWAAAAPVAVAAVGAAGALAAVESLPPRQAASPAYAPAPAPAAPAVAAVPPSQGKNERRQSLPPIPVQPTHSRQGQTRPPQTQPPTTAPPPPPGAVAAIAAPQPQALGAQHQAIDGDLPLPPVLSPTPRRVSSKDNLQAGISDEPAAAYLMNMVENEPAADVGVVNGSHRGLPPGLTEPEVPRLGGYAQNYGYAPAQDLTPTPGGDRVRPTIITSLDEARPTAGSGAGRPMYPGQDSTSLGETPALGRRPSGARAIPPVRKSSGSVPRQSTLEPIDAEDLPAPPPVPPMPTTLAPAPAAPTYGLNESDVNDTSLDFDQTASAYLAYADQLSPSKPTASRLPSEPAPASAARGGMPEPPQPPPVSSSFKPPQAAAPPPVAVAPAPASEVRSSFAPSKAAAERRAKAEQAEVQRQRAMAVPGGGKRTASAATGAQPPSSSNKEELWSGSDEDEDDEEDEEDATLPTVPSLPSGFSGMPGARQPSGPIMGAGAETGVKRSSSRALPPVPRTNDGQGPDIAGSPPQVPVDSGTGAKAHRYPSYAGVPGQPDAYGAGGQYPPVHATGSYRQLPVPYSQHVNSSSPNLRSLPSQHGFYDQQGYPIPPPSQPAAPQPSQPQPQTSAPAPAPATAPALPRPNIWNANFAVEHGMPDQSRSGKFVELEEPSAQLTKAFAPHGLLQAGMQDKEDRSARKQEEMARETGSSLVNVPAKPPPPQAGLLGAVAAHERDRKNPGGIGATLTDRDRERRLAEDRQRKIEELQRQQMEHMSQYGMYSQPNPYPAYNPYMSSPYSPYGMNMPMPSMGMGYSTPHAQQQAMYAAQMAYQQAYSHVMAMSAAGSQVGTPGEDGAAGGVRSISPVGSMHGAPGLPGAPSSPIGPHPQFQGNPYFPHPHPMMGGGSGYMSPPPMSMYGLPPHSPYGSGFLPTPGSMGPPNSGPGGAASVPLPGSPHAHSVAGFPPPWTQGPQFRGSMYDLNAQTTGSRASSDRLREDERQAS